MKTLAILTVCLVAVSARNLRRCANLFDEGCGLPGAGLDESWFGSGNSPGRRSVNAPESNEGVFKSLSNLFHRMHLVSTKRCAFLFDESCSNGGLPGASADESWLGSGNTPGKRCAGGLFDEACNNGGLPGAGADESWLGSGNTPGKRCAGGLFDEACNNGGLPGASADESWLGSGNTPGKRCAGGLFDQGCHNGGLIGSANDEMWKGPGRK